MLALKQEKYSSLYGELMVWRDKTHNIVTPKKVGILPFVSGLRFSANIIYILNELFEGSKLRAAWGHIVDEDGEYNIYSRESDIIIYQNIPKCTARKWNGDRKNKVMDFYFIYKSAAVGVISCKKSKIGSIDKKYPDQLKDFTEKVWLFAECCGHDKESEVRKKAKAIGYKDFWSLYSWDKKKGSIPNVTSWKKFEDTMLKLAQKYP